MSTVAVQMNALFEFDQTASCEQPYSATVRHGTVRGEETRLPIGFSFCSFGSFLKYDVWSMGRRLYIEYPGIADRLS